MILNEEYTNDLTIFQNKLKSFCNIGRVNPLKIKPFATRNNGCGKFVNFGGGKYENNMARRLLKGFEKRVKGALGKHMNFVYNINSVFCLCRGEINMLSQSSYILNAVVGGGINFRNIHNLARRNFAAGGTFTARVAVFL